MKTAKLKTAELHPMTVRVSDVITLPVKMGTDGNFYVSDKTFRHICEPTGVVLDSDVTDFEAFELIIKMTRAQDEYQLSRRGFRHPYGYVTIGVLTHVCEVFGEGHPKCEALLGALDSLTLTEEAKADMGHVGDNLAKLAALCMDVVFPDEPSYIVK